jgi:Tfp pilus assembly protein PilO
MKGVARILDTLCLVGLVALLLGGGFIVITSARARTARVERRHAAIDMHLSKLTEAQSVLQAITHVVESNQSALEALRERLPELQGMGSFLSGLDSLVQRRGVNLSSVMPGQIRAEELCSKTVVQFACSGSFASLHAVLHDLEMQPRLVRIQRAVVTRPSLDGPCKMEVACYVYSR